MLSNEERIEVLEWKVKTLLLKLNRYADPLNSASEYDDHLKNAPPAVLKEIEEERNV